MTNKRRPAEVFHPGEYLVHELCARGMSIEDFADSLGWSVEDVESVLLCKEPITNDDARDIAKVLGTSATLWMRLNEQYYAWQEDEDDLQT